MKTGRLWVLAAVASVTGAGAARADGYYFEESYGFATTHDDVHHYLKDAIDVRAAVGIRLSQFAFEAWIADDRNVGGSDGNGSVVERTGGPTGRVDLVGWGLDLKYLTMITPKVPHLEAYLRGSIGVMQPTGMLEGYSGRGYGFGAGIQLKGKVRALGFLWTPLFFMHKGPLIMGSLYIDTGADWYGLHHDGDPTIGAEVVHVNVGFSAGTDF